MSELKFHMCKKKKKKTTCGKKCGKKWCFLKRDFGFFGHSVFINIKINPNGLLYRTHHRMVELCPSFLAWTLSKGHPHAHCVKSQKKNLIYTFLLDRTSQK